MEPQQQQQQQQQNSTFIDDNLDTCLSLLNLPESPILPPKHQHYRQNQDNNNYNKNIHKPYTERLVDAKQAATTATTTSTNGPQHQERGQNQHGSKANGNGQHTAHSRRQRHRSISLYGVNSTVEQGHKEIPIWLDDDEPRYVSGVTNKTTCNDIIKALIDDELSNNNNNNIQQLDGYHGAAAASRDYSDYVITERWRGIERSYDGNMAILPVWRAWSRVHNELRLSLKQRRHLKEPLHLQLVEHIPSASGSFSMFKWIKKLLRLTSKTQKVNKITAKTPAQLPNKANAKILLPKKKQQIPEELMLILLPDQNYEESQTNRNAKAKIYKLAETRTKQRRRRSQSQETTLQTIVNKNLNNNCIRRRRKPEPLRNSVRNKLAALHAEMNARYEKEYVLTRELTAKCKQYKLQNEQYKSHEMELSVGQLQRNIEAYAEDIIKTENELLELKNDIKQDISLINNLKRMTLEQDTDTKIATNNNCVVNKLINNQGTPQVAKNTNDMQFVDNIYEFCDNNASMLV